MFKHTNDFLDFEPVKRKVESDLWLPKTHPRLKFPFPSTTTSLSAESLLKGAGMVDTVNKFFCNHKQFW